MEWAVTHAPQSSGNFAVTDALGFEGPPFRWAEERRQLLRCELDAIHANLYGLDRSDPEWILDAPPPSESFPSLKKREIQEYGEYRTQRLVLSAFDAMERGAIRDLSTVAI